MPRGNPKTTNGKPRTTRQSVDQAIKSICDIMRRGNMAGAMQYVPELTWILFLRILDETEAQEQDEAEALGIAFTPSLATPYRWRDWAAPDETQRKALEAGKLGGFFAFVNGQLLPHLKNLERRPGATVRQKMISEIMSGVDRVRIDTERNFRDVLDRVHDLSQQTIDNPHKSPETDHRTPAELLDLIEAKGREITEALAVLRNLEARRT